MKNVIFTYDSRAKGEEGEASMTILLDDDRAAVVKAAYDNRQGSSEIEDILLRCKVDDLCAACEALRGAKVPSQQHQVRGDRGGLSREH
jgi:hypothetical protein